MKTPLLKHPPALIALGVISFVCLVAAGRWELVERLERITYDWRVRLALHSSPRVADNLGFARIEDETVDIVKSGELGYRFGLYWPRQVYGNLVRELHDQGAQVIAFDVLFGELRNDHPSVRLNDGSQLDSDEYFAREIAHAGNVILAATTNLTPLALFTEAAASLGDIATDKDPDGILRRARAFTWHQQWHPALEELAAKPGSEINLRRARLEPGHLIIPLGNKSGEVLDIELDAENQFSFGRHADGTVEKHPVFTPRRVWHMGIVMAAHALQLDLDAAVVDLPRGRITLTGPNGVTRIIPVDRDGYFFVDWSLRADDVRLTMEPVHSLLRQRRARLQGQPLEPCVNWRHKLVVVGSSVQGNDLMDRGATPLDKDTLLVSKHWNVANAVLVNRFIHPTPLSGQWLLIILLGGITAWSSIRLRILPGLAVVLGLAVAYTGVAVCCYVMQRWWLPLVLPLTGALFVQYGLLVTYRALFEQREQRRVKGIFSRVVSPNVARELLGRESLSLSGERLEVSVLFADVRGFTELTDKSQEQVAELIRQQQLEPRAAEAAQNEAARETLNTVNAYLATVADVVKKHDGTLDKYIGDCVMAFWGAPTPHPQHALSCVRAAIEAQRSIQKLNEQRQAENQRLEIENQARRSAGLPLKPLFPILTLGTGINTGIVTVGLMGSNAHILNYTVFGREVNLASRLEGVSGHGRIIIGEGTYLALQREAPDLAAACLEQEPTKPKGFQRPVRNFEVPWQKLPA